jgi:hypothetical protein
MPTNLYISQGYRGEQNLYEDLIIESIKFYGQDVYYLPREIVVRDGILSEDIESKFGSAYAIEMYVESVDGYEGDGTFLSKFGLEIRDSAKLVVAKRRWEKLIGKWTNPETTPYRPKEGDLIYVPFSKSLFEIRFVEHEQPFYQLKNLPVYKLQVELFEYRSEKIDTGIAELDEFEILNSARTTFRISGGSIGFKNGEIIVQTYDGITISGEVAGFKRDPDNALLADIDIVGIAASDNSDKTYQLGEISNRIGSNTGWTITKIYGISDGDDKFTSHDHLAQNSTFEQKADDIIDFSESNPFGEIGNT